MAVLKPLKVTLTNYPEDQVEEMEGINNPEDESMGKRKIYFSRTLYIERDDFMEDPPKKFFRLSPGKEVRLRYAYIIKCEEVVKDPETGEIIELKCTYDHETKSGSSQSSRKVKGTLHWVSAQHAADVEVRLYDRLFDHPDPAGDKEAEFLDHLNPNSLEILTNCKVEPFVAEAKNGDKFQFERLGYFCVDSKNSSENNTIFNRTVTLRDTWVKIQKGGGR
jgi:glutaminyl-tRNA synthetase